MGAILAIAVKKLAEGDFGEFPARAYWWLAGKKTWTAVVVGTVAGGLQLANQNGLCDPCGDLVVTLGTLAGILAAVGLFDGAVRMPPPAKQDEKVSLPRA